MMKRFVISILSVAVFFVGLGSLVEHAGAKFKSDEKALEIVRKARTAIGGDAAIAEVRGLVISGRSTHQFKVDGSEQTEQGETEIAMQFPDKLMKSVKIGKDDGTGASAVLQQNDIMIVTKDGTANVMDIPAGEREFAIVEGKNVVLREKVVEGEAPAANGEKRILIRKAGNSAADEVRLVEGARTLQREKDVVIGRSRALAAKQNELLRLSLALLVTAPEGIEVNYTFAGESDIDGTPVNIVNAEFGGANYKLFFSKSSGLPVAMSYAGFPMPAVVKFVKGEPIPGEAPRAMTFTKKIDAEASVEHLVKFSDYRINGSVQFPYRWTTSVGGVTKETFDVTAYDINPANLAERFKGQKTFVRMKSPDGQ